MLHLPKIVCIMCIIVYYFRLHRSTTYVDGAYCCRPTLVGPKKHVLDKSADPPYEGAILTAERAVRCENRDALRWAVQKWLNWSRCRLYWVVDSYMDPRKHVLLGVHICGTWRLANTIEPFMSGGDVAFLLNYFDHLLVTHRRSIAERGLCFQRRLVCQFVCLSTR